MSAKTIVNNTVALAKAASGNGYAPAGHFHEFTCLWGALGCACRAA